MAFYIIDQETQKYFRLIVNQKDRVFQKDEQIKPLDTDDYWTDHKKEATEFNSSKEGLEFLNAGLVREGYLGQYTHFIGFRGTGDQISKNVALIEENG